MCRHEVITSNRRLKSGASKPLPRITICPYYQLEESVTYSWKKVMVDSDSISKKWGINAGLGIMPGQKYPDSFQALYLNLNTECLTNECQCDFNPFNQNPRCMNDTVRGCGWARKRNTTITGRTCQKWLLPIDEYLHMPNLEIMNWSLNNNIDGNHCINTDQDLLGPWCYTTDPNFRFEYCGICDVDISGAMEFGHYRESLNFFSLF